MSSLNCCCPEILFSQGFFDTLRMEIADSGVTVHMVCPGPVQTPFFKRLFGATVGKVQSRSLNLEWI